MRARRWLGVLPWGEDLREGGEGRKAAVDAAVVAVPRPHSTTVWRAQYHVELARRRAAVWDALWRGRLRGARLEVPPFLRQWYEHVAKLMAPEEAGGSGRDGKPDYGFLKKALQGSYWEAHREYDAATEE